MTQFLQKILKVVLNSTLPGCSPPGITTVDIDRRVAMTVARNGTAEATIILLAHFCIVGKVKVSESGRNGGSKLCSASQYIAAVTSC